MPGMELALYPYDWWSRVGMDYPIVATALLFWVFAFGSCLGSFLNVCIWRIPRGESVINAPSHCTSCGADIRWFDNIPIVSYIVLRGRCRSCHTHYTARYFIVELLAGLLFTAAAVKAGLAQQPPATILLYWWAILFSVSSAWIDAEHRIIPDALTYPAMLFGLAIHALLPSAAGMKLWWAGLLYSFVSALIPGVFLALFTILGTKFTRRPVLGWGDVKFTAACGALLGLPGALFVLLCGSLSGTLYGVIAAKVKGRNLKKFSIAFGPFLAAGVLIWIFAGNWIWLWYLHALSFR